ncbi:hypothetical protein [Pseudomonas fluorescens]|uniref:hypothetical protein n=1 Tax=Pseudomonas fluorescens TaxID=294 RepID=UPI003D1F2825
MSDSHSANRDQRKALGLVTDDNSGGYFVVECQGCGAVYPSFQCAGGGQIADTGDYDDAYCPHCEHEAPDECDNVGLVWNTQQLKINSLQLRLNAADQRIDELTSQHRGEPAGYQYRQRPMWRKKDRSGWMPWRPCAADIVEHLNRNPEDADWQYETRALYPGPAPASTTEQQ